jgi:hypothetical protein
MSIRVAVMVFPFFTSTIRNQKKKSFALCFCTISETHWGFAEKCECIFFDRVLVEKNHTIFELGLIQLI